MIKKIVMLFIIYTGCTSQSIPNNGWNWRLNLNGQNSQVLLSDKYVIIGVDDWPSDRCFYHVDTVYILPEDLSKNLSISSINIGILQSYFYRKIQTNRRKYKSVLAWSTRIKYSISQNSSTYVDVICAVYTSYNSR